MKITVVTVCRNAVGTIEHAIQSVSNQSYEDLEYIVVDGASTDGTLDIIKANAAATSRWVSEPDSGIYDAMNKGIAMSTGDIIGFLNADDVYADPEVISRVADAMGDSSIDACYSDLVFVKEDMQTIVRYYRSDRFSPEKLAYGWMPAHPTLFLRRSLFSRYGVFKTDYNIAADYELVARLFWKHRIRYRYLPGVSVKMRMGGVSTRGIQSNVVLNKEIVRACKENGIRTSFPRVLMKYPMKLMELFGRPS